MSPPGYTHAQTDGQAEKNIAAAIHWKIFNTRSQEIADVLLENAQSSPS